MDRTVQLLVVGLVLATAGLVLSETDPVAGLSDVLALWLSALGVTLGFAAVVTHRDPSR